MSDWPFRVPFGRRTDCNWLTESPSVAGLWKWLTVTNYDPFGRRTYCDWVSFLESPSAIGLIMTDCDWLWLTMTDCDWLWLTVTVFDWLWPTMTACFGRKARDRDRDKGSDSDWDKWRDAVVLEPACTQRKSFFDEVKNVLYFDLPRRRASRRTACQYIYNISLTCCCPDVHPRSFFLFGTRFQSWDFLRSKRRDTFFLLRTFSVF